MSDATQQSVADPVVSQRRGVSWIWLLPLVALLVTGWLAYQSWLDRGPVITVDFPTAEGLAVDKTRFKFRDVDIGKITEIRINDDQETIRVTGELDKSAEAYLGSNTRFWVVRPRVDVKGISGLGTLLSGPYIQVEPGDGERESHFMGLSEPPLLNRSERGKEFILSTDDLGTLQAGLPVYFHGVEVGEVLKHDLAEDGNKVVLSVFIREPYDRFVRKETRFWNNSGVEMAIDADGLSLRTGSLLSLLEGGIAFETPRGSDENPSAEFSTYHLYKDYASTREKIYTHKLRYVMYFDGNLRGLSVGAPVELRGMQIGQVLDLRLEIDSRTGHVNIPVTVELEPERVRQVGGQTDLTDREAVDVLIKKGLRAELQTASMLTGQQIIELDFKSSEAPRYYATTEGEYPEFPTIPSSLDRFTETAVAVMDRMAKLPLDQVSDEVLGLVRSMRKTSDSANHMMRRATGTLNEADKMFESATETLGTANQTLTTADSALETFAEGSPARFELEQALSEVAVTARSLRVLADYLERKPEAFIRGKTSE